MQREGSPWQGLGTVVLKELADHLGSARMRMLEWLMVLTAAAPLYMAIDRLRETTSEDPFLLLRLFTVDRPPLPSFVAILSFMIPLVAIGLGFDAINGEHNRRTLSRVLAQPIYRDALLAGKFIAGLATLAITLMCIWLLVVGFGVLFLGVPPSGRGNRPLADLPGHRGVLWRGVACGGNAVLGAVSLTGDRGAAVARRLAVHEPAVADDRPGAGAGDFPAGHPVVDTRLAEPGNRAMAGGAVAHLAQSVVRRVGARDPVAVNALAWSDFPRPDPKAR